MEKVDIAHEQFRNFSKGIEMIRVNGENKVFLQWLIGRFDTTEGRIRELEDVLRGITQDTYAHKVLHKEKSIQRLLNIDTWSKIHVIGALEAEKRIRQ